MPAILDEVSALIVEALEHERGGVNVYRSALRCAQNDDLRREWQKYLEQTEQHVQLLTDVCSAGGINPEQDTPGRGIVRMLGESLVSAITTAERRGVPEVAELVACECVILAETKDHANWDLLKHASEHVTGPLRKVLADAVEQVHEEEGEHLFHTKGWCRELWIAKLGMRAVLPPPEERKHVKTAIGASRAEQARDEAAG